MPNPLSAVESISPAFARTKRILFLPFRFGLWARLGVVAVVTGEAGLGGGGGTGGVPNFNRNSGGEEHWASHWTGPSFSHGPGAAHFFGEPAWEQVQPYLGWIFFGVGLALAAVFLWIYSDCVYRFILLDTVVTGQCRLREGWRRWRAAGRQYFVWVVSFGFVALFLTGVVAGVPGLLAYRAGWFEKPEQKLGLLIGWGILVVLALVVLVAALAIIEMLARDFLVPVMAFEEVGPIEGWRRLLALIDADKVAYAGYVLMKIVLAVGSAILFAVVNLIVILILAIPLVLLALTGYFAGKAVGMTLDVSTGMLLAALGLLVVAGILYVIGFVYAPGLVFFQSYTLEFFAARYGPLGSKLAPIPAPSVTSPTGSAPPPMSPLVPGDAFPS